MILAGVLAICLLTLLAAYGGESSTPQNTGTETTAIEPELIPAGDISTLLTVDDVPYSPAAWAWPLTNSP